MRKSFLYVILIHVVYSVSLSGQETTVSQDYTTEMQDTIQIDLKAEFELFNSNAPLKMDLTFDMRDLIKPTDDPDYISAHLYLFCEPDTFSWDIRIKARGEFRRNFCDFPPIMINVKGVEEGPDVIKDQQTMKLVTHCRDRRVYQEYVFREFLIYKMYNIISPYSFQVRLVSINYIDESDPDDVISSYGFLIENLDHLAERNGADVIEEIEMLQQQDMIPDIMARLAVFQYMIGNFDWQVATHNVKLVKSSGKTGENAIPVPYDFDFSGFVDADYAIPRKNLGLTDVKQRRYLGDCELNNLLLPVLDEMAGHRIQFNDIINSFELLDDRTKNKLLSYLNEFYDLLLDDKERLVKELQSECILILN